MVPRANAKHILIVEDSPDLQMLLSQIFSLEGYPVCQALNGKVALDLLNTTASLPALILLDIMMPVMDGFQFRQEQEKDPRLAAIPIVIMTADIDSQTKATKLGAVGVIRKPMLDIDALLGIAAKYCS